MKCMVTWTLPPENFKEAFARFKAGKAEAPTGVKILGGGMRPAPAKVSCCWK